MCFVPNNRRPIIRIRFYGNISILFDFFYVVRESNVLLVLKIIFSPLKFRGNCGGTICSDSKAGIAVDMKGRNKFYTFTWYGIREFLDFVIDITAVLISVLLKK